MNVSLMYLVLLLGVSVALVALLVDALVSVSRKPQWALAKNEFALVPEERRTTSLPFVGVDRRRQTPAVVAEDVAVAQIAEPLKTAA